MTPDPATQCDARHGNERCRKAAHHAPADPWHESANHVWQRVSVAAPSFFGASPVPVDETMEDLRAELADVRAKLATETRATEALKTLAANWGEQGAAALERAQKAERLCVHLFDLFRAAQPHYAWDVNMADKEAVDDMRERLAVNP